MDRDDARPLLEARMRAVGLVNVVGVEHGLRLAGHGLRKVADLDALVLAYREGELEAVMGLNQRESRLVQARLLAWTKDTMRQLMRGTTP